MHPFDSRPRRRAPAPTRDQLHGQCSGECVSRANRINDLDGNPRVNHGFVREGDDAAASTARNANRFKAIKPLHHPRSIGLGHCGSLLARETNANSSLFSFNTFASRKESSRISRL